MESGSVCICCPMKKNRNHLHRILRILELPQDIDPHLLVIRWIGGGQLLIEQHRGILRFDAETIRFASEQGVLVVAGTDLIMDRMNETSALILGDIRSVFFEDKSSCGIF